MSSLVVSVSPKQEKFILSYVKSGRARNTSAVVRRALAVLAREEQGLKKAPKPKKLSPGLRAALRDVAAGRVSGPFNSVEKLMSHLGEK